MNKIAPGSISTGGNEQWCVRKSVQGPVQVAKFACDHVFNVLSVSIYGDLDVSRGGAHNFHKLCEELVFVSLEVRAAVVTVRFFFRHELCPSETEMFTRLNDGSAPIGNHRSLSVGDEPRKRFIKTRLSSRDLLWGSGKVYRREHPQGRTERIRAAIR